jgi:hypothetical protein
MNVLQTDERPKQKASIPRCPYRYDDEDYYYFAPHTPECEDVCFRWWNKTLTRDGLKLYAIRMKAELIHNYEVPY